MQAVRIPVAQEGLPFVAFSAFCSLIFACLGWTETSLLCLAASGFILWFFRDPVRIPPIEPGAIVAPADGKVILVRELEDDRFLGGPVQKISIFMNIFNVHVNRIPYAGTVQQLRLQPGLFYAADDARAELRNEYCALTLTTADGGRYAVVQVAGLIARRIVCRAEPGDTLKAGERYGLIRFGSRVDLYLPPEADIRARAGNLVRAGETVLGYWPGAAS